jgi:hypothetical protein
MLKFDSKQFLGWFSLHNFDSLEQPDDLKYPQDLDYS